MKQFVSEVLENRELIENYFEISFFWPADCRIPLPGQIVTINVTSSSSPYLRRPFALSSFHRDTRTAKILYQVRGPATQILSRKRRGDTLDCLGPRGFAFTVEKDRRPFVVGGGFGVGPLVYAAQYLVEKGHRPLLVLGFASKNLCPRLELLPSVTTQICTADGTQGFHGTPVHYLESLKEQKQREGFVWTFDTRTKMKETHLWAQKMGLPCQVCWDEVLACTVGACQGCTVASTNGGTMLRTCTEGPVFRSERLVWT